MNESYSRGPVEEDTQAVDSTTGQSFGEAQQEFFRLSGICGYKIGAIAEGMFVSMNLDRQLLSFNLEKPINAVGKSG
jgi:hypothetical protein